MNLGVKVLNGVRPTDGLSQSNHHLLAGGCLRDPTDDPLDAIHPDLQLHVGSEATRLVVVCWPRHYWRLQRFRVASAPLAAQLRRKRMKKQEALSQDVLKATIMTLVALKNKQTRSSTCGKAPTAQVKQLQWQTGADWTRTDRQTWQAQLGLTLLFCSLRICKYQLGRAGKVCQQIFSCSCACTEEICETDPESDTVEQRTNSERLEGGKLNSKKLSESWQRGPRRPNRFACFVEAVSFFVAGVLHCCTGE